MGNCKLQFHGHHSYFRNDFQMLIAVNIGYVLPPYYALGSNNKVKKKKKIQKIDH